MATIRLDVNLFNAKDDSVKRTNCVPLKEFDISSKKLSDVRSVLIENGGLDASKVGCSFCSPTGALVNDASSFSDYVDILSEGGKEKESDDKKTKIFNVYVYLKSKKTTTGLSDEVKETIKKELNLKLSDKPELLKASLDQLTSSFNKADWVAEASEDATNPADMSEKEWNIVIRNNSLTSASRLVFSNLGRALDGTKKLKFRRIERAPYSAFVLKPRKFEPHEISHSEVKVEQQFHIPRFVVADDSYVDTFETKSSVATAMARSSFSSIEAEASIEGGAFGFSAAVSAGFSSSETSALSKQSTAESSVMNITYNFPRVVLHLDEYSLALSDECSEDLMRVKDVNSLIAFHHKYGHFFATRVELGGRLFSSEKFSTLGTSSESEATKQMKISASASFSSKFVSGSVGYSQENGQSAQNSDSRRSMQSSISWQAQGGDTLLCNKQVTLFPPAWCPTVAPFQNWRVIKQEDVIPLGDFIGRIPGYEDIPNKFNKLAEITRRNETVSFRLGLDTWQRADEKKPEYLSLHHAWRIRQEVALWYAKVFAKDPVATVKALQGNFWAMSQIPSSIQALYDAGLPGLAFEDNNSEDVFDVEVETLLNQAPALQYGKRYHIFNRKRGLWLRAIILNESGKEVTVLAAGPKHEATLFEFRDKDREGPMRNGDKCTLLAYGPDGKQKGIIAWSLRGEKTGEGVDDATSVGALPYSVPNEGRIRFTVLEMLKSSELYKLKTSRHPKQYNIPIHSLTMKFTAISLLLAASTALASPANIRSESLKISGLTANASKLGDSNIRFTLTDPNYPDDTPTNCTVMWSTNSIPPSNARCNGNNYYIRLSGGVKEFDKFTIELERVSGPIKEIGQASFSETAPGSKWECKENPQEGVLKRCYYNGVMEVKV
ncbi:hypothetical protein BDV38DRAFT_268395 [Aspergillus pseudotamarii]|uniref:MACPF-like domain-containing protein n=1 Tax=Aspergillus pseudotamarii TaxID=132259 RepID=A0A5N6T5M0_ASPPS|nr:uncharacterized protein BDV38DRAFT_268395 [Aspergillus pseudotamarii]KAE8141608.1 hypothetical protein BDV38DRAFT_268395 [Aspergillus pseudotamarii]